MARSMSQFGNDLYTGKTSFPFVGRRNVWFLIAAILRDRVGARAAVPPDPVLDRVHRRVAVHRQRASRAPIRRSRPRPCSPSSPMPRPRSSTVGKRHRPRADEPDDRHPDPPGHRRPRQGLRRARRTGQRVVHRAQLGRGRHPPVAVGSRDLPRADLPHPRALLPHLEDVGLGDHRPRRRARSSRSACTRCSASRSRLPPSSAS